ncbi:hypothetical protein BH23BAC4_BH23BAC4_11520 [soil metagenome]
MTRRSISARLTRLISLIALVLVMSSSAALSQSHEDWSCNLGIYEVNVRQYTQAGTFAAFETHLDRLQEMGVGILWFMPIHPIGQQNRLGSLGSYYSVRDFLGVNPEFGTLEDFRALVHSVHERGMYILMDWVPNHTSWDNSLTTQHPEWYSRDGNGNFRPPPGTNWSDVIQLDHSQPGLRAYMIEAMRFWVEDVGVDGFRFDAVDFVPQSFWAEVIPALREIKPDIFLLAESDGRVWHDLGFDASHGWGLYGFGHGVLRQIAAGTAHANDLNTYAAAEISTYPADAYRMYFTANHDENSWYGTTTELFGNAAEAFAVLTHTFNGIPLIYSGQEAGLDRRLRFFDKDQITWRDHPNAALYTTLLHLKRENRALWNGAAGAPFQRVSSSNNAAVFAFTRERDGDKVFVAMNVLSQARTVTLSGTSFVGAYRDVFSDENVTLEAGATLSLPPWGYVVYEATDTDTSIDGGTQTSAIELAQNYPNPFESETTIAYTLGEPGEVRLAVYDLLGREVRLLESAFRSAGRHEVLLSAANLAPGVYLYRLTAGGEVKARRLVVR